MAFGFKILIAILRRNYPQVCFWVGRTSRLLFASQKVGPDKTSPEFIYFAVAERNGIFSLSDFASFQREDWPKGSLSAVDLKPEEVFPILRQIFDREGVVRAEREEEEHPQA